MDRLDRILKELIKRRGPQDTAAQGAECISEERFAEYLGGLLDPSKREDVEKHLNHCETCFQKSILFSRVIRDVQEKGRLDMPERLVEKTGEIIEVILAFGKDVITVIDDPFGVCSVPEAAALRVRGAEGRDGGSLLIKLSRNFSGINADILIEKTGDDECEIEATLSDFASGVLLDDMRLNLLSAGRELASYLTVKGRATFKNLKIGNYILKIYKGKDHAGSLVLKRRA